MPCEQPDLRLAWSVAPEFRGRREVVLSWFCLSRMRPALDPAGAVRGFAGLGHFRQQFLTRYLAELLTGEEAAVLGEHLAQEYGLGLQTRPAVLPLDPGVGLFGMVPASFRIGLYTLPARLVNCRPFDVCAYYDLDFTADHLPAGRLLH